MGIEVDNELLISVQYPAYGKPYVTTGFYDPRRKVFFKEWVRPFPKDSVNAWANLPNPVRI